MPPNSLGEGLWRGIWPTRAHKPRVELYLVHIGQAYGHETQCHIGLLERNSSPQF